MKNTLRALAGVAILALGLTACSASEPASDPAPAAEDVTHNEELRALLPEAIRDRGYVTVASDVPYPPFEFLDEDGSTIIGADPDLGVALGELFGIEFRFEPVAQVNIIPGLSSGKYDIAMSAMSDRIARQEAVSFVDYMKNGGAFVAAAAQTKNPQKLEDLCGMKVAVQSATTMATGIAEQSEKCVAAGEPAAEILEFQGQDQVLLAITSNRAEIAMLSAGSAGYMASLAPTELKVIAMYSDPGKLGIVVEKGDLELIEALRAATQELMDSGAYEEILTRWGLFENNSIEAVTINDAIDAP